MRGTHQLYTQQSITTLRGMPSRTHATLDTHTPLNNSLLVLNFLYEHDTTGSAMYAIYTNGASRRRFHLDGGVRCDAILGYMYSIWVGRPTDLAKGRQG